MNANVRVPFTEAQRQELERQTMIYKYMTGFAPVPPQLLVPITKTPSNFAHLHSTRKSFFFYFSFFVVHLFSIIFSPLCKNDILFSLLC